ncbi:MAG: DsrH/TusB family sulfur metabolism protein [Candidatus Thorarchaeota archaeon]
MTNNLDVIYLFGFSELTGNHLRRLLPILKSQLQKNQKLGLVLIQDGVIGISTVGKIPKQVEELLSLDMAVYAMIGDIISRGIRPEFVHNKIETIQYDNLIDLIENTPKVISWM